MRIIRALIAALVFTVMFPLNQNIVLVALTLLFVIVAGDYMLRTNR